METSAPVGCGGGGDRAFATTLPGGRRGLGQLGGTVGHIILENREEARSAVDLIYVARVDECCTKRPSITSSEVGM